MRNYSKRQWDVIYLPKYEATRDVPYYLIFGVPNSGKTAAAIAGFIWWTTTSKHQLFGICTVSYKLITQNLLPEIRTAAEELGFSVHTHKDGFTIGTNRYVYLSANNAEQRRQIQAFSFKGIFVDEVVNLGQEIFEELEKRLRGDGDVKLWMTANPSHQNHWFKKRYVDRADEIGMHIERLEFADNPTMTAQYVSRMRQFTGARYRQVFLGEWANPTGLIYTEYKEPAPLPDRAGVVRWFVSLDPAASGTAHALLIAQYDDGVCWIAAEWRNTGVENPIGYRAQAESIKAWLDAEGVSPTVIFVDPASPNMAMELRYVYNDAMAVFPARNDVAKGIYLVQSWLAHGRLRLSNNVPALHYEMTSYVWDTRAAEYGETKPIKWADHGCDAMRYFVNTVAPVAHYGQGLGVVND